MKVSTVKGIFSVAPSAISPSYLLGVIPIQKRFYLIGDEKEYICGMLGTLMRMSLLRSLFLVLVLSPMALLAQGEKDFKDHFEEGNKLIQEGIYDQALKEFKKCVEAQPSNSNANYKVGLCYIEGDKNKKEALSYLSKAVKDITKRYKPFSHREDQAPPKVRYYYGRALHLNMLLDSAISVFKRFKGSVPKRHVLFKDAERHIEMCKYAKKQVRNRKDITIRSIGKPINSEFHEYSPVISVDENVMYFTSRRPPENVSKPPLETDGLPFESIYASFKGRDGKWGEPERLEFNSNTRHDAVSSTSPSGQKLFIFRSGEGNGDLFHARLQGENEWSEPKPMGSDINSKALEPHGVLSPDGNTFYFVSNRDGGEGGRDIYRCKKLPTGDWSKAQSLGPTINTPLDEDACFIHPDGETMYFSSNGHESMGGYDILYTEKKDNGEWKEPENMGFPINTVDDDRFFVTSADGKRGYYASEKEDGLGGRDIYQLKLEKGRTKELAVMKGFINVPEGQDIPDKTKIKVTSMSTGKTWLFRPRERDGVFVSILPPCKDYKVEYMVGNEVFKTEQVPVPCDAAYQEIKKEIYLNPVDLGDSKVVAKNASRKRKWKVVKGGKALKKSDVVVKYVKDNGKTIFTENLSGEGTFAYYKLPGQKAYKFQIETSDPHLCQELELLLVNQKGKELGRAQRTERCSFKMEDVVAMEESPEDTLPKEGEKEKKPGEEKEKPDKVSGEDVKAIHRRSYDYNQKGLEEKNKEYQEFLDKIESALEGKEKAVVSIRGNASKVPTRTFESNEVLAEKRAQDAQKDLKADLKERGVSLSDLEFRSEHRVTGPVYEKGNIRRKVEYLEHQYVRIKVH
ncbi:MAG: hypothetical protein ABEH38_05570 [Flavobacteriales bacterium]